jgi:hypothetical protein
MKLGAAPAFAVRVGLVALVVFSAAALGAAPARAQESMDSRPSVFTYAGRGFMVGGMVGVSAGYMAARGDTLSALEWQPLAYGLGIGALTGGALGLTLGILDTSRNTPGYGALILRDTVYGAGFGALAGGIVGGLTAISSHKGEHILLGASVGTMIGAVAGIVLGVIEGNRALERTGYTPGRAEGFTVQVATAMARDADGKTVWMPAAGGVF